VAKELIRTYIVPIPDKIYSRCKIYKLYLEKHCS